MKKISFVVIVLLFLTVTAAAQRVSDPARVTVTTKPTPYQISAKPVLVKRPQNSKKTSSSMAV
jgi:hypothetical protein